MKSTFLSIGLKKLSELAKEIEFAGKAEHYELIMKNHAEMLDMYARVAEIKAAAKSADMACEKINV